MPPRFSRLASLFRPAAASAPSSRRPAWLTGAVAVGAVVAGRVVRTRRRLAAEAGEQAGALAQGADAGPAVPPALDAATGELAMHEGVARYYMRAGVGVPIVLLPGVSPVGSCAEVAPLFAHFAATTDRPLYAFDWLGFGRSDRPAIRYHAGLYQRQLRHALRQTVGAAADVVAFGVAGEYAAAVAVAAPALVRRLVLVAPGGLSGGAEGSLVTRMLVGLAGGTGAFRLFFRSRLARREAIRRYYADAVFVTGAPVPDALVEAAERTVAAPGADHAPQRLAEGLLFMDEYAPDAYARLACPTLVVLPALTGALAPLYDALPALAGANDRIVVTKLDTGLLPQWEQPEALAARVDAFLDGAEVPRFAPAPRAARRRVGA